MEIPTPPPMEDKEENPTFMNHDLFRAAITGDTRLLVTALDSFFVNQTTPRKNNIIHIAAEHDRVGFITEALGRFPELLGRKNDNSDTPLHVAARNGNEDTVKMLLSYHGCANEKEDCWVWMARNLQGDTPLHVALCCNNLSVAMELMKVGSNQVLGLVNHKKETPLHTFLRYCTGCGTTAESLLEEGVLNLQGLYRAPSVHTAKRYMQRSSSFLKHMVTYFLNHQAVMYMCDDKGLNPLLIAAQHGCFFAVQLIIEHYPQSVEVCDKEGRTVLHHLKHRFIDHRKAVSTKYKELKEFLSIPEIKAIKDRRDHNGNTPLHVAISNQDFVLVRILFEYFADFTLKNMDGISALDMINSLPNFSNKMEEETLIEKILSNPMDTELQEASIEGNLRLFEKRDCDGDVESGKLKYDDNYFLGRTSEGLTILHFAVKYGHLTFVEEAIRHFPILVLIADSSGETPLHVAARLKNKHPVAITLLQLTKHCVDKFREKAGALFLNVMPYRQKNSRGNTPLHEALCSSNYEMAINLMHIDSKLALYVNRAGETPLHTLARYGTYTTLNKLGDLVKLLIGNNDSSAYTRDAQGFTPLLRAAYCGRLGVAHCIVNHCPSSVKFPDLNGRNFLHHLRLVPIAEVDATIDDMLLTCKDMLRHGDVDNLRSSQDHDGDTPLHFALKSQNFATSKFLLSSCEESNVRHELSIINKEGRSVTHLLESLADDLPEQEELKNIGMRAQWNFKTTAFNKQMMDEEVYRAAVTGDMCLFNNQQSDANGATHISSKFLSQAPDGSNILHIAIQHSKDAFIEEVLQHYPHLIFETDFNGDTPLHIAAKFYKSDFCELLQHIYAHYEKVLHEGSRCIYFPPWSVKNSKGNTPLHEVLQSTNFIAMEALLEFAPEVTSYVNNVGETPLHVFTRRGVYDPFQKNIEILDLLLSVNSSVVNLRDNEGLTPLLRAAKTGRLLVAHAILKHSPQSIQLRDPKGRTFLHLLQFTGPEFDESSSDRYHIEKVVGKPLFKIPEVDVLRAAEDFEGNTPLHLSIKDGNSIGAKLLAKRFKETDEKETITQLVVRNDKDQSIFDLIALHDDAPNEVLDHLLTKVQINVGWVRSSYGVSRSQIKEMVNTLSVVAALLATITFAAAFQVPGGFDSDGTPVLLKEVAYKVFAISNTFAMCGSMAVLFSLLWVMFTGKTSDSFLLLDLSISALLISFDATLIAFMTGVYVTISHKTLWLAILVCAICSTIIVLSKKKTIIHITRRLRHILTHFYACRAVSLKDYRKINSSLTRRSKE